MSSTNRGAKRNDKDYYVTPDWIIEKFFHAYLFELLREIDRSNLTEPVIILDPCGGGCDNYEPAYVKQLEKLTSGNVIVHSMDIREDAKVEFPGVDYLECNVLNYMPQPPDIIISNPPLNLAREFVEKSQKDLSNKAFSSVIYLLRQGFFGTKARFDMMTTNAPIGAYLSHKRPGFDPKNPSKTDSCEYAHMIWGKQFHTGPTMLRVI